MSDNKGKLAPSPQNYLFGKGFLIFKPTGETDFFHLGNCPRFEFVPAVEKLEHFSSMEGTKEKDATIVTQKTGTVTLDLEEFTKRNLGMLLMGDVDDTDPDDISIDIFSTTALEGELRFYATNDVGPRWRFFLNKVQFTPSGAFSPISDAINKMTVTGDVFSQDGTWGTARLVTGAAPENITLPFIIGEAVIGETIEVSNGGWLDVEDFTYQWKDDGVNISGATSKTLLVLDTYAGGVLTCVVTGTNDEGSDSATSIASSAVTST
jgi:hypothetical protein